MTSDEQYRRLFERNPQPMWLYDPETLAFVAVNEAAVRQYGYSVEEFLAMTIKDIRPQEDVPVLVENVSKLDGNLQYGEQWRHRKKDGSIIDVEVSANDLEFGGRRTRLVMATDITARREAESQRRRSEASLANAQRIAHLGSWELETASGVLHWSDEVYRIFGQQQKELVLANLIFLDLVHPDDRSAVQSAMRSILKEHRPVDIVHRIIRPDGEVRYVHERAEAVLGEDGRVVRLAGSVQDVTQQTLAEQEIRRLNTELEQRVIERTEKLAVREALYRTLTETAPQIIWMANPDGKVIYLNRAWQELTGLAPEESLGSKWQERLHPDDVEARREQWKRTQTTGEPYAGESRTRARDGTYHTTLYVGSPVKDAAGKIIHWVGITTDINERKRAEEALSATNKELEAFTYSVSHDLRAPLRAIDGFSLALARQYEQQLDETARHYLSRIRAGTQRMGELIDDLLQLSRINRGELRRQRVDLSELARGIANDLRVVEPQRRVELRIADDVVVQGDEKLLAIALENLLQNAWKFTGKREEASIEFGTTGGDRNKVHYLKDNGAGFDMAYADKLFGVFQRLHRLDEFPGTGVGLATVQRIIHRHGGRIWAESAIDRGATFYFTLGPVHL